MIQTNSLRLRVVFFYVLYGAALSILVSVSGYFALKESGRYLIDETLHAEMEDSIKRHQRNPKYIPPNTVTIKGYVLSDKNPEISIPTPIKSLAVGTHNIELDGIHYRVLVAENQRIRYFLLFDTDGQYQREKEFQFWMLLFGLFMIASSGAGGFFMASRIIAPVTRLAAQVSQSRPEAVSLSLSKLSDPDEIGNLARAFELYLHRLKEVVERESYFLADMSHELRTPLAVILGTVEVLEQDVVLTLKQKERIARIKRAVQEMIEQTNALLLMARDYAPSVEAQTCSLAEVVEKAIELHKNMTGNRAVEVVAEVNSVPELNAERPLLDILIGNLLRNALFHTDVGQILLRLESDRLVVRDTGVGMSDDELVRAQERHFKGSTSAGAGIGLSLVRRICDRYGWQLSIESEVGQGTTVTINFLV